MAVNVTPNKQWDDPKVVLQANDGQIVYDNLPLKTIKEFTPLTLTIRRKDIRTGTKGLVIFNEEPLPNHKDTIDTETNQDFDVVWIGPGQKSVKVDITRNTGWPNGKIILLKD